MILENKKDSFEIKFGGRDFTIPEGVFEVKNDLGSYIVSAAKRWDKKINVVDRKEKDQFTLNKENINIIDNKIEEIKKEEKWIRKTEKVDSNLIEESQNRFKDKLK